MQISVSSCSLNNPKFTECFQDICTVVSHASNELVIVDIILIINVVKRLSNYIKCVCSSEVPTCQGSWMPSQGIFCYPVRYPGPLVDQATAMVHTHFAVSRCCVMSKINCSRCSFKCLPNVGLDITEAPGANPLINSGNASHSTVWRGHISCTV